MITDKKIIYIWALVLLLNILVLTLLLLVAWIVPYYNYSVFSPSKIDLVMIIAVQIFWLLVSVLPVWLAGQNISGINWFGYGASGLLLVGGAFFLYLGFTCKGMLCGGPQVMAGIFFIFGSLIFAFFYTLRRHVKKLSKIILIIFSVLSVIFLLFLVLYFASMMGLLPSQQTVQPVEIPVSPRAD